MSTVTAFFIHKPTAAERKARAKAKARATAKANLTKAEEAAIRRYFHADATGRKAMLLQQADNERKARIVARRKWRKAYQRQYRAMAAMASVII
jgi:hypothetical protein